MGQLIESWKERRDALRHRGAELASATRERGVHALGRVRDGALDWHATLTARGEQLRDEPAPWFRFRGLRLRVIERFDRSLVVFGERVRDEIQRLSALELEAPQDARTGRVTGSAHAAKTAKAKTTKVETAQAETAKAETAKTKTAKAKTAKAETAKTKTAKAETAKAKTAKAKTAKAKTAKAKTAKTETAKTKTAKTKTAKTSTAKAETEESKPATGAARKRVAAKRASKRFIMPVTDYDQLSAKEILAELPGLTETQRETVAEHERTHKNRKTVLRAIAGYRAD